MLRRTVEYPACGRTESAESGGPGHRASHAERHTEQTADRRADRLTESIPPLPLGSRSNCHPAHHGRKTHVQTEVQRSLPRLRVGTARERFVHEPTASEELPTLQLTTHASEGTRGTDQRRTQPVRALLDAEA